jgi:transposase
MLRGNVSSILKESAKRCKDAKERERLRALYALSAGYPIRMVADIFSVGEATLYRWMERWREERSLSDKPKMGRPGSLSEEDKRIIKQLVAEEDPKKHGADAIFWNTKELKAYFLVKGKHVSQETIRRCLKEMGATYIKEEGKRSGEVAWQFLDDDIKRPYSVISLLEDEPGESTVKRNCGWKFQKK